MTAKDAAGEEMNAKFNSAIEEIARTQQQTIIMIGLAVAFVFALIAAGVTIYVRYAKKALLAQNGAGKKKATASEIMQQAALQSRVLAMVLKANRFVSGGLTDDKHFSAPRSLALNPYATSSAAANSRNPEAVLAAGMAPNKIEAYNLAIVIGVDSPSTPTASEDAGRIKELLEAEGSYTVCLFTSKSFKPSTTNIAQVIKQLQDAERAWRSVVVFVAAPLRPAPCDWVDVRAILRQTAADPPPVEFISPKTHPKFLLEFPSDAATADDEQTWVDLGMLLRRLKHALGTAGSGSPAFPIAVFLDVEFDATACEASVGFMRAKQGPNQLDAVPGAGSPEAHCTFADDERLRIPSGLMAYLSTLTLKTAAERLVLKHQVDCVIVGCRRVTPAAAGIKVKKSKTVPLGASTARTAVIDASTSLFVRTLLEGVEDSIASSGNGALEAMLKTNMQASQRSMITTTGTLVVPVSTSNTQGSVFHRCVASPASIVHHLRHAVMSSSTSPLAMQGWLETLFISELSATMPAPAAAVPLLEHGSLMPHRIPASPLGEWRAPRSALHQQLVDAILQVSSTPDSAAAFKGPFKLLRVAGPKGAGKTTVGRAVAWNPVVLRGFGNGIIWIDMHDFAPTRGHRCGAPSAASVFIEVTDVIATTLWTIVGGVNSVDDAKAVWLRLLCGSNAVLFIDHLDRSNETHSLIAQMLDVEMPAVKRTMLPSATSGGRKSVPSCGLFTLICVAIEEVNDTLKDVGAVDAVLVPPMSPDELLWVCTENTTSDELNTLLRRAFTLYPDVWVARLLGRVVDAASGDANADVMIALRSFDAADQKEAFIDNIVDAAIAVAALRTKVPFEQLVGLLQQHIGIGETLVGTANAALPSASVKFQCGAWNDRLVFNTLIELGVVSDVESQRPRRTPASRFAASCLVVNPVVLLCHHVRNAAPARAIYTAQRAYEALAWPARHNHATQLLERDAAYHVIVASAMNAAARRDFGAVRFQPTMELASAFSTNFSFLRGLAARTDDATFLAILSADEFAFDSRVADTFKAFVAAHPLRLRGTLEAEMLRILYSSCTTVSLTLQELYDKTMLEEKKPDAEVADDGEGKDLKEFDYPFATDDFNSVDFEEVFFETPLGPRRRNRFSMDDDEEDEGSDDDDEESESESTSDDEKPRTKHHKKRAAPEDAGAVMTDEMLAMRPPHSDFCALPCTYRFVERGPPEFPVTAVAIIDGYLYVARSNGTVTKHSGSRFEKLDCLAEAPELRAVGGATMILKYPAMPPEHPTPRLVTASQTHRVVLMWSDLELITYERVETIQPPPPGSTGERRFGPNINSARLFATLCEPGVNVDARAREQLQFHRDLDYARYLELTAEAAATGDFEDAEFIGNPHLRSGGSTQQSRRATTVLLTFSADEEGDALEWNQRVAFGKHPEEAVCAATITLGSPDTPLRAAVCGPCADANGRARIVVVNGDGNFDVYCLISYSIRDSARVQRVKGKHPAPPVDSRPLLGGQSGVPLDDPTVERPQVLVDLSKLV